MSVARQLDPDPEQVAQIQARRLLELAGAYVRRALEFPDELDRFRTLVAELLLENAMLRLDLRDLATRVERLEKRRSRS